MNIGAQQASRGMLFDNPCCRGLPCPTKELSRCSVITILSALSLLTSCNSSSSTVALNGAGSTFVYPVMGRWIQDFQQSHTNVRINYQSIGSGGGIQQVKSGTIDFGASDAPLSDQDMAQMAPVIQIPESAGPVCVTYNLDGLAEASAAIVGHAGGNLLRQNHKLAGPVGKKGQSRREPAQHEDHRGSPRRKQRHHSCLHHVSFCGQPGVGATGQQRQAVKWPTGLGAKGSEGVTGQVKQSPGAISYVELTYATQNKLPVAAIKNQAGKYVLPSTAGTTAAIDAFKDQLAKDPRTSIANPPASAPDAYPISTLTFLIIPKDGKDRAEAHRVEAVHRVCGDGWAAGCERLELRSSS